ncbi:uracil-DNA glycosylase [Candidatus Villigracilis affinis]|uniref:uracil-DNA glycosylase n=1 Tax=Candidatus Villigracilis affinis TaxID=3140682 RepID=UPI001D676E85|nr:uracil-DNA glycosylase [Anaerolineales bacterium]
MSAEETLAQLAGKISVCTNCVLNETRKKSVPGDGPADAEIMFIGEGPGFHENEQGHPFVGAAGKFLDQLLAQAGVTRDEVFIGNVVKCRPPGNRDPLPEELAACDEYLEAQIQTINPSIIVTLGRFSMNKFIPGAKISTIHGQMRKVGERFVIPMFHPAAALHQAALKPSILADFANLPDQLNEARAALGRKAVVKKKESIAPKNEKPKQLSLF